MEESQELLLKILSYAIFKNEKPQVNRNQIEALLDEAKAQSVFPYIFSAIKGDLEDLLDKDAYTRLNKTYFSYITNNIRINLEHGELHKIMAKENIPYVVLKGCASASYYSEPDLRTMGDVDFLVHVEDIDRGIDALEKNGFKRDEYEFTTNQSAYHRPPKSIWEIHKAVSGIPVNEAGEKISECLADIIEKSRLYKKDGIEFFVPSEFHHGLVLLLHKASHMITTGIGLRHLCDWAVFESRFSDEQFALMYEEKLKSFGMWRFAQIITLTCIKYLGAPARSWASKDLNDIDGELLENIINDIMTGGNFGHKDENRFREIKYLTDRDKSSLGDKNMLRQLVCSLNSKVYNNYQFIDKHKIFLPVGWINEGVKYFTALITGKRKSDNTINMLKEASHRKEIYRKMQIFQCEEK